VILLENFNEWNLSPAKRRILKKKKKRKGLKSKRGETSYKKLHISKGEKKKRMKFASYWERFY
jgi:sulfur relay (sulfurtransferase) DsrC/TusE family protein